MTSRLVRHSDYAGRVASAIDGMRQALEAARATVANAGTANYVERLQHDLAAKLDTLGVGVPSFFAPAERKLLEELIDRAYQDSELDEDERRALFRDDVLLLEFFDVDVFSRDDDEGPIDTDEDQDRLLVQALQRVEVQQWVASLTEASPITPYGLYSILNSMNDNVMDALVPVYFAGNSVLLSDHAQRVASRSPSDGAGGLRS